MWGESKVSRNPKINKYIYYQIKKKIIVHYYGYELKKQEEIFILLCIIYY